MIKKRWLKMIISKNKINKSKEKRLTGDGIRIEGGKGAGAARAGEKATGPGAGAGAKIGETNLNEVGAGGTG
jgi:hypothetical protein